MSSPTDSVVRIGVVGGGLIAQVAHLPALRALDARFAVRALAEPGAHERETLLRRYGIPAGHAGHEALLGEPLDAVLVCSPSATHARVVLDALDAGLHVLVEKPLCIDPADARAIAARAAERGRVVQVGYMKRYDPAWEQLLEELGAIGELALASAITLDPGIGTRLRPAGFAAPGGTPGAASAAATGATARAQVAAAIGSDDPRHATPYVDAFLGALVHDVNLLRGIDAGAARLTDAAAGERLAYGAWTAPGGARFSALWSLVPGVGAFSEELRVVGADGALTLRFPAPYHGTAPAELVREGEPQARWAPAGDAYVRSLERFHACVTAGEPCRTPAADAAQDVALLAGLYREAM